jgi:hypothetical protein
MYEIIWRFSAETLDRDAVVRPVFEQIRTSALIEPAHYDLNQKEQWRVFDLERVIVDALTQRTQLVRVRAREERSMVMIAMGKHGEEPTAVLRVSPEHSLTDVTAEWPRIFEELPVRMTLVTSPDWRDTVEASGLDWDKDRLPIALACGWPPDAAPDWLAPLEPAPPVDIARTDGCNILTLAPEGRIVDADHRQMLGRLITA